MATEITANTMAALTGATAPRSLEGLQPEYRGPGQGYTKGIRKGLSRASPGRIKPIKAHVRNGQSPDSLRHTSVGFDYDTLLEIDDLAAEKGMSFAAMVRDLVEWGLMAAKAGEAGGE